jgi:hypothetical protein
MTLQLFVRLAAHGRGSASAGRWEPVADLAQASEQCRAFIAAYAEDYFDYVGVTAKREHRVVTVYASSEDEARRARVCAGMFRGRLCP